MAINEEIQFGRAKNGVLNFLEQQLSIPKIYMDAKWDGHRIDVLAINRDGVGDVHAVLLFAHRYLQDGGADYGYEWETEKELLNKFAAVPAQYKYIAVVDLESDKKRSIFNLAPTVNERTFAPDGLGRVGFLKVDVPRDGEPQIKMEIKPERFRAKIAKLADEYVQQHEADWEIRA